MSKEPLLSPKFALALQFANEIHCKQCELAGSPEDVAKARKLMRRGS